MQKKFYLLVLLIGAGLIANAQITKGTLLLGGDVDFNAANYTEPTGTSYTRNLSSFVLSPSLGKAIRDNFVIGFKLDYEHTQSTNVNSGLPDYHSAFNEYNAAFFMREYKPLGKGFSLFADESLGGGYIRNSSGDVTVSSEYDLQLSFYPGVAYKFCRTVELDAGFPSLFLASYTHTNSSDMSKRNILSAGTHLSNLFNSLSLGFRLLLGS